MEDIGLSAMPGSPPMDILLEGMGRMREGASYEELIQPVRERMMRVIWRVVRHREEAEDTLQDALTTIWRIRGRVIRHPNPQALILKICANKAVDALRRRRRGERFAGVVRVERLADPIAHGRQSVAETEALVRGAVGRLPKKQAAAVVLRILEGYSYREIGEALGCREATARTHVLRGRVKLSRWLSDLKPAAPEEVSR